MAKEKKNTVKPSILNFVFNSTSESILCYTICWKIFLIEKIHIIYRRWLCSKKQTARIQADVKNKNYNGGQKTAGSRCKHSI
jgi:hypothetical protein